MHVGRLHYFISGVAHRSLTDGCARRLMGQGARVGFTGAPTQGVPAHNPKTRNHAYYTCSETKHRGENGSTGRNKCGFKKQHTCLRILQKNRMCAWVYLYRKKKIEKEISYKEWAPMMMKAGRLALHSLQVETQGTGCFHSNPKARSL